MRPRWERRVTGIRLLAKGRMPCAPTPAPTVRNGLSTQTGRGEKDEEGPQNVSANGGSKPVHKIRFEMDQKVPMRDGVLLSADVYRPAGVERAPAILYRTPYDNNGPQPRELGHWYAERGYAFVAIDCRGRCDADGKWYAWHNEADDGYDTQEWVGVQPWCDGQIGTVGGSYCGLTQWLPAPQRSKYLKAMVPRVTPSDFWHQDNYVGGAFQLCLNVWWSAATSSRVRQNLESFDLDAAYRTLPLSEALSVTGRDVDFYRDWLEHEAYDDYWREISNHHQYENIDVPVFNLCGWYDAYAGAAFINFAGMREHGRTEATRDNQKILIGPWTHSLGSRHVGELDFGGPAQMDLMAEELRWFDYWLKGIDTGIVDEPRVKVFTTGANRWTTGEDWPLAGTEFTPCYLHSGGRANTLNGDGSLSFAAPGDEPPDRFDYDPAQPVPTIGGNHSSNPEYLRAGPYDQRNIEMRADVLVYTSEIMTEELQVTGPVTATLHISSSAPDTDFTARLVDVAPDGYAMNLCEGILRVKYRDSWENPELMTPGETYRIAIDLGVTSHAFLPGHRIRLDISSSSFPRFDRNLNTGEPIAHATEMRVAHQTVHHSAGHPSSVVLPIVRRS
jgi:putative CocE/NonD family hydrolase